MRRPATSLVRLVSGPVLGLGVGLALLQGCGSCAGDSKTDGTSTSGGGIATAGQPLLGTSAGEGALYGPDGGGGRKAIYAAAKDAGAGADAK